MPNSYLGIAAAADFTAPIKIILDGEDFQYGDADTGYFSNIKALADRTMALKEFKGTLNGANAWTGLNLWNGPGVPITFGPLLSLLNVLCEFHFGDGCIANVDDHAELHVKSGGKLILEAGSLLTDAGDRTISGDTTNTGAVIHSGNGGKTAIRVAVLGTTATVHADCTKDTWQVSAAITAGQTVRLDTPSDPTKNWLVTVSRNRGLGGAYTVGVVDDASGDLIGTFMSDAYMVLNSTGPTYSTSSSFAWAEFFWDTSGTPKWRIHKGGGTAFRATSAEGLGGA